MYFLSGSRQRTRLVLYEGGQDQPILPIGKNKQPVVKIEDFADFRNDLELIMKSEASKMKA